MELSTSDTTASNSPKLTESSCEPPDRENEQRISVAALSPGSKLNQDIFEAETEVLLLASGATVTPRFLSLLASRGIRTIRLKATHSAEADDPLQSSQSRILDTQLDKELKKETGFRQLSVVDRPRLGLSDLRAEVQRGVEHYTTASSTIAEACESLSHGKNVGGSEIGGAIDLFANQATSDVDLLPLVFSIQKSQDEYLFDHCINIALLSMSVASSAGLPREQIKAIGLGAVLQDIGMLRVPQELRLANRKLSKDEFFEIQRHPIHALDWLERVASVPVVSQIISYQSHERVDQTGYPRRRASMFIHPLSKIVGIADSYVAMTQPRPYRPARLPYEATRAILSEVGKFERSTVRMFLDAVGLFPPGSYLELDNGTQCRVVRANPDFHTRPLVEELDNNGKPTGRHVNLSQVDHIHVARAIPGPQEPSRTE